MQVVAVQLDIAWEDKAANHERVASLLSSVAVERGALIVLPEMFATGYSMNVEAIAETSDPGRGASERFCTQLAQRHNAYVVAGVVRRDESGRGQNQAIVIGPDGRELVRYTKMRPMTAGGEAAHYAAGQTFVTFDWRGMTVAPFICYDIRFPELFRAAVRKGTEMFVVIANFPAVRADHWAALLRARAIENQAYVVAVNRVGLGGDLDYRGGSVVIDPRGVVIADAGDRQGVTTTMIDPAAVRAWREEFPALGDMRDDV